MEGKALFTFSKQKDQEEYERVTRMIEETRAKCQETISSCSSTLTKLHTSLETLSETRQNIDKFYDDFNTAMTGLCNGIASSFQGVQQNFKKGDHSKDFKESHDSNVKECFELIKDKKRIVFLTGAGISIASGISGFRGIGAAELFTKDGVTYQNETIATVEFMKAKPAIFWERNLQFVEQMKDKTHNISHVRIQELMNVLAPSFTLVTQNIDGLHLTAFDKFANAASRAAKNHIYEIHGNKDLLRCNNRNCSEYEIPFKMPANVKVFTELMCPKCSQLPRPHILYFDESYTEKHQRTDSLTEELKDMDALVCVGTMLETGYAARMVSDAVKKQIPIIEINLTPVCQVGAHVLKEKAELVIPELCDALIKYRILQNNKQQINQPAQIQQRASVVLQQNANQMKQNTQNPRRDSLPLKNQQPRKNSVGREEKKVVVGQVNKVPNQASLPKVAVVQPKNVIARKSVVESQKLPPKQQPLLKSQQTIVKK